MKPCHQRLKRGIAGGLVWINFDRHALMNLFNKARGKFVADVDEIRPQYQDSNLSDGAAIFNSSLVRSVGPSIGATIDQLDALTLTEVGSLNELATPWYADQVLPFDITLAGANEYGAMTAAKIFGVQILNEGSGISIDDTVSEAQATFVARGVEPMQAVPSPPYQGISSFRQQEARAHARQAGPYRRPAVVQEVTLERSKMGSPVVSRFTGGNRHTEARYIVIFNDQWALMEQKRDGEADFSRYSIGR